MVLREIQDQESKRADRPELYATVRAALIRCARRCLAEGTVTKSWFEERGWDDVLAKLRETRIKRLIEAERARLAQPALTPALEQDGPDTPLVPGRALADFIEQQYIGGLAEWKNVHIVESRSYVRDQALARQVKEQTGGTCQCCGDRLDNRVLSRRFVHAHHLEPLSEGGADTGDNMVVLCPNCHARLHAKTFRVERRDDGIYATTSATAEPQKLLERGDMAGAQQRREQTTVEQVVRLAETLGFERRARLVQELLAKLLAEKLPPTSSPEAGDRRTRT